jgi:AmmeMemoRadiSam system protein A
MVQLQKQGQSFLLSLARQAIAEWTVKGEVLGIPSGLAPGLLEKRGVFCTIRTGRQVRGCAGLPEPVKPLAEATISAALASAFNRAFKPLGPLELPRASIELTILTEPVQLIGDARRFPSMVEAGRHGLLIRNGSHVGLLLPSVATEYGLRPLDFLGAACERAGLHADAWREPDIKVFTFEGVSFSDK